MPDRGSGLASFTGESGFALEVRDLDVWYGRSRALDKVSFGLRQGERLALFGPNGAGKTTLLRALAGLVQPTSGQVLLGPPGLGRTEARRLVGVVAHQSYLYPELTVRENLRFYGELYRVARLDARVDELLGQVQMERRRGDRVATLSRGMQQRVALARALLHDPPILLLDEPETGLDLAAFQALESLLIGVPGRQRSVVLASHNLELGLRLADRAALLVGGRLVHLAPTAGLDVAAFEALYRGHLTRAADRGTTAGAAQSADSNPAASG